MTTNAPGAIAPGEPTTRDALLAYIDATTLAEPIQARLWHDAEITLTQLAVLRELRHGSHSAGRLGERVGLSPTSMTRLVDRLEARGLVKRRRHVEDRRRVEIELEPAGETLLGAIKVFKGTHLHQAIEAMSGEQRGRLVVALRDLVEATRSLTIQERPD